MWRSIKQLWKRTDGAVAPTIALSMVGLIAAGGIAFDYAHLVTMDTELQQAADQAALAAATQLDRAAGSRDRAVAAIDDGTPANRLARNLTRFSNDGAGAAVEIDEVKFCSAFNDDVASTDAACTPTTVDEEARFVIVRTSLRTANYTLTPIVGAISGTSSAEAVAGVESSICNIAPLFVCTEDVNFPSDADIGKGLLMKTGAQNSWFPGNYGYLDFGPGNPAVEEALMGHGLNGCQPIDESNTQPGNKSATDAINTRFDVYSETGQIRSSTCTDPADGFGCPDQNTHKDLTKLMTYVVQLKDTDPAPTLADVPACGTAETAKNANPSLTYDPFVLSSAAKGMPRDTCHYSSCQDGNFGDGAWEFAAYMTANHPGTTAAALATTLGKSVDAVTRYDVYKWEIAHQDESPGTLDTLEIGAALTDTAVSGKKVTYTFKKQCGFRKPIVADAAEGERRILPILAANCEGMNGAENLDEFQAIRVFNVFLTEPSMQRTLPGVTDDKEIYGEIIGPAQTFEGGSGFQYYSRNRPYLIR